VNKLKSQKVGMFLKYFACIASSNALLVYFDNSYCWLLVWLVYCNFLFVQAYITTVFYIFIKKFITLIAQK